MRKGSAEGLLSIISLSINAQSGINSIRTIRAIRAYRLLKGVARLREIVNAILSSVSYPLEKRGNGSVGPARPACLYCP